MDKSAAGKLYNASLDTPMFHLEDIYVTGILSSKVHIRLVISAFILDLTDASKSIWCDALIGYGIDHKTDVRYDIIHLHNFLTSLSFLSVILFKKN